MPPILAPSNNSNIVAGKNFRQPNIGILALQGDVSLHARALKQLGIEPIYIKQPSALSTISGLIIPGGESTALLRLAEPIGMLSAISDFAGKGNSIFGTCAGAILLAHHVSHPKQESLNLINITIKRNGYGRQLDSRETTGQMLEPLGNMPMPMVFIRAPRITYTGPDTTILARYQAEPVVVQQTNILIATFHPELTDDITIYKYWLSLLPQV